MLRSVPTGAIKLIAILVLLASGASGTTQAATNPTQKCEDLLHGQGSGAAGKQTGNHSGEPATHPATAQAHPQGQAAHGTPPADAPPNPFQEHLKSEQTAVHALIDQYMAKLGVYNDPFASAWTPEVGERIFQRLLTRPRNGRMRNSPLALINSTLKKGYSQSRHYNERLVRTLMKDAQDLLIAEDVPRQELQSELLALRYTLEYIGRYKDPEKVVDRDGKPEEKKDEKKEEKKDEKKEEEEQNEQDSDPEYPETPEQYEPKTKDTENKPGKKKQKQHRVAETNFKTPFFGQRYFSEIVRGAKSPFREGILPSPPPPPGEHMDTTHEMVVRTFGKRQVPLFVPSLKRPLQPSDPRAQIKRTPGGGYVLELKEDLPEIKIPLVEDDNIVMMPHVREVYTRPVGFRTEEWPDKVQADIFRKYPKEAGASNPLGVAQAVANHLATQYLYSVGKRNPTDPIEALKEGAFQCDMAAYAMAGILRDTYQIPTRVIGGFRAKRHKDGGKDKSYLVVPGQGHAWVEVFHDGAWHLFDPTPIKKDKKEENKDGEKDEYSDQKLDNTPKPEQEEQEGGKSSDSSDEDQDSNQSEEGDGKKEKEDHKKRVKEDTDKRIKDVIGDKDKDKNKKGKKDGKDGKDGEEDGKDSQDGQDGQDGKDGKPGSSKSKGAGKGSGKDSAEDSDSENGGKDGKKGDKKDKKDGKEGEEDKDADKLSKEDLIEQLELGSLELEPTIERNAMLERAMRMLLKMAVEPTQRGLDIQSRLNQLGSVLRRFNTPAVKQLYEDSLSAHSKDHPGIKAWIEEVARLMSSQDINKTYQSIHQMRTALEVYAKLLDRDGAVPVPDRLIQTLLEAQRRLERLAHPDSQDIALVQDLVKDLPSVARMLLKSQYDLSLVGPNSPTRTVAQKLKSGALDDVRLLSILSPVSDFILNSTPRPETIEVKTWMRDTSRPRGRDLLPATRFSELHRAILGQPGKTPEENMRQGTAHVPVRRKRIDIPAGYGKQEAERITIVLYDTSGSMSGDPGTFQAGLISAFTARALSDVSPSGRHRHRVLIVPFDTECGTPVRVTNNQEALNILRNYQNNLKNTGGGTDIQKALMQAMALIADAERRAGEPLAAANIVLMTDGQASIDPAKLMEARQAIDRQTPLQTMFIAINQTSEELMRYAMDSQAMGADKGFYREFTGEHISKILKESHTLDLTKKDKSFYSDKTGHDIPIEVHTLMDQALRLAAELVDHINAGNRYTPAAEHLKELEKLTWRDQVHIDRPLEKWFIKVRNFVKHPVFNDRKVLEHVVDDLVRNMERLVGDHPNNWSNHEQEQLRHLVRYAAGLEDADK